ncbi:MAG: hypothetical protein OIF36_02685 [Alphaproteobacteria bacterium]|nr:hypothetical protein [Alphaproteobacteria bacterium]
MKINIVILSICLFFSNCLAIEENTIKNLKNSYDLKSQKQIYTILNKHMEIINKKPTITNIELFLESLPLYKLNESDALHEFFQKSVENIIISNRENFFLALSRLRKFEPPSDNYFEIISFLRQPILVKKQKMNQIFLSLKKQKISTFYFKNTCVKDKSFRCLKSNFPELRIINQDLYYEIWNKYVNDIKDSSNLNKMVSFMEFSNYIYGASAISGEFDDDLMQLCINNPITCLDSVKKLNDKIKNRLFRFHLPSMVYPSDELDKVFEQYRFHNEYKDILKLYFNDNI